MKSRQPGIIIIGTGLFVIGLSVLIFSILGNSAVLARLWPFVLILLGSALLIQARQQRPAHGLILSGLTLLFFGLMLSVFSFRIGNLVWADLVRYWPLFLFIIGMSFMIIYLQGDMKEQSLLIPTYLFGGTGTFLLPITLGIFRGTVFSQMLRLWPLLILIFGLVIFLRIREQREQQPND